MGFNIFNSHPLALEAHTDADVLILMALFLKQNSLWKNNMKLSHAEFDYTRTFFLRDVVHDTPFFAYELSTSIPSSGDTAHHFGTDKGNRKRKFAEMHYDGQQHPNRPAAFLNVVAANNLINMSPCEKLCRHDFISSYIELEKGKHYCISCFCSMFFVANDTIKFKDKKGLQEWINEALETLYDERLVKHLDALARVECSTIIHKDYKFWNLINSLDVRRQRLLPSMNTGLLLANMNSFGKMLLVLIHNCLVVTGKGKVEGRWFDVDYTGPNLWRFQVTSCKERTYDSFEDMACLETLRRLPRPGSQERILSRMIFKAFCRGETLSSADEMVSDAAQTVKNIRMNIEGRRYFFDVEGGLCSSSEVSDEVLVSLEVTGYRPVRAQNNMNSNRVSARVMRLLSSREGGRGVTWAG